MTQPSDDKAIETFRTTQEQRLAKIREVAAIDGLIGFGAIKDWIDQAARHFHPSSNGEACWRAFLNEFFPTRYHSEAALRLLYKGLRGPLSHQFGTSDVFLTEENPASHWTVREGLRVIHLPSLLDECDAAWQAFSAAMETDAGLRARIVCRTPMLIQPLVWNIDPVQAGSATPTGPQNVTQVRWQK